MVYSRQIITYLLGITAFALTYYIAVYIFNNYPISMDEYNYWYQAKIFASGKLSLQAQDWQLPLVEKYMVMNANHQVFSKYPPAFSALLSVGMALGAPEIINPIISTISALLIFGTLQILFSWRVAVGTTALLVTNSYFLGYGASYFAQPLSLCVTAAILYLFCRYEQTKQFPFLIASLVITALAIFVRPLDAACIYAALCFYMYLQRDKKNIRRNATAFVAIPLIGALSFCGFNWLLTGEFSIATYPILEDEFRLVDSKASGIFDNIYLVASKYWRNLDVWVPHLFESSFIPYLGLGFFILTFIGLFYFERKIEMMCVFYIACIVLLYNFHPGPGSPQYGARYWYPIIPALAILAARGVSAIKNTKLFYSVILLVSALQLYQLYGDTRVYSQRFEQIKEINKQIEQQCPNANSIVVLHTFSPRPSSIRRYVLMPNLIRNPFMKAPRLYVDNEQKAQNLKKHMRNYQICHYLPDADKFNGSFAKPTLNWDLP